MESVEIPILRKDKTTRIALWNSANIYDNERKILLATIAQGQDITERKQAEESLKETRDYLENLLDYASAPIIVWDADFKIVRFNNAFSHLTGYDADEVIGKKLDILFPKESKNRSLTRIRETLKGEHWESVEIPILRKNKETRIALWNSANIYDDEKKQIIATIAQGQDITERKKTELELQKVNQQLLNRTNELFAVNKELESFSYSVSHDLRAPLRSIDGFSQALIEDYEEKLDDQGKDYIQRVRKATQRMGQLIDDMLRLSRLTRTDLTCEIVDISSLSYSLTEKLQIANPSRTLKIEIQPKMSVKGDKKLLEILMENLLENAWKFTSQVNNASVKIGEFIKDGEQVFFVRDNGAGFDMAYADKLFIPFQRLHSVDEYPGTGIGLALVSRIVHRHGGRIWAEGEVGKGATFYFTLQKKE